MSDAIPSRAAKYRWYDYLAVITICFVVGDTPLLVLHLLGAW
jgi:hypothetical protein